MTRKENLKEFFDLIEERGANQFGFLITVPNCPELETIINPIENLQGKKEFYLKAYDDDLVHSMNDKVVIVDWFYK